MTKWDKSWSEFNTRLQQMTAPEIGEFKARVKDAYENGPKRDLERLRIKRQKGPLSATEEFRFQELSKYF